MKIWTQSYRPFIMGGDVNAPVWIDIEPASEPYDLGKGYKGVTVISPSGKIFVAEIETGAIVGSKIREVRADIEAADEDTMRRQIEDARKRVERACHVHPNEFWRQLKGAS